MTRGAGRSTELAYPVDMLIYIYLSSTYTYVEDPLYRTLPLNVSFPQGHPGSSGNVPDLRHGTRDGGIGYLVPENPGYFAWACLLSGTGSGRRVAMKRHGICDH